LGKDRRKNGGRKGKNREKRLESFSGGETLRGG